MDKEQNFDLVVIGGGPGGYVAAIRAAQLGMKTALVEKMDTLGGTCLNVGCIPSKALLDSSGHFHDALHSFEEHGILTGKLSLDLAKMLGRKDAVVKKLTSGVAGLIKGNKITLFKAEGLLKAAGNASEEHSVELYDPDYSSWSLGPGGLGADSAKRGTQQRGALQGTIQAKRIVLAMGSSPVELPFMPFDGERIISSTGALNLPEVPKTLAIIGAGAIGLEMAQVWASLGSKVTVIEMMDQILPGWDAQLARGLMKELKDLGIEFLLGNSVKEAKVLKTSVSLTLAGEPGSLKADRVLVAVGRKPALDAAGIQEAGIGLTEDGRRIQVDADYQTSRKGVYAIGDLVPGPMLAHKAEDEAVVAVERMNGIPAHLDYSAIPGVVYTHPEGASLGMSEEQLKEKGIDYRKGVFNLAANGRALALGRATGFVKILADPLSDRILGAHILGPWASDLIAEITAVYEMRGTSEDIARIVHAHPTLPEAVKEAALGVHGRSIHSLK